jgi:hypothetical protein
LGWRDPTGLSAFKQREAGIVNAVIETPMGSRNKFKYDEDSGFYSLSGVLPLRRTPSADQTHVGTGASPVHPTRRVERLLS